MDKVRGYFQILYQREEPHTPGILLAIYMYRVQVNYLTPSEAEVEASVFCLCPHKAVGHTLI